MAGRPRLALACLLAVAALVAAAVAPCSVAHAGARADVAALQVALGARGLYGGGIDGVRGPGTASAVRGFQRVAGLAVDGIVGRATRRALGRHGRHPYGSRTLRAGRIGWDVAALQFKLETHGFPCGHVDGGFASHTTRALARFQGWAGLAPDGVAGPATYRALRRPAPRAPFRLRRPLGVAIGDRYGPRGSGFHPGLDFPAPTGTPVGAAGSGRVIFAGWNAGGYGNTVVVADRGGVRTLYAHLSSIAVRRGVRVGRDALIGRVGATGFATGPHLHFEVIVRGANVDPLGAIG